VKGGIVITGAGGRNVNRSVPGGEVKGGIVITGSRGQKCEQECTWWRSERGHCDYREPGAEM
jgi:hypothetical protein